MQEINKQELLEMAHRARGQIDHIYLHWTAGRYHQLFSDYHLLIKGNGALVASTPDFTDVLAHTWNRNTGSLGIALCCAKDAVMYADGTLIWGTIPRLPCRWRVVPSFWPPCQNAGNSLWSPQRS